MIPTPRTILREGWALPLFGARSHYFSRLELPGLVSELAVSRCVPGLPFKAEALFDPGRAEKCDFCRQHWRVDGSDLTQRQIKFLRKLEEDGPQVNRLNTRQTSDWWLLDLWRRELVDTHPPSRLRISDRGRALLEAAEAP